MGNVWRQCSNDDCETCKECQRIVAILRVRANHREEQAARKRRSHDLRGHQSLLCVAVELRHLADELEGGEGAT